MAAKPELILDIAGVLTANFSPVFWQQLSSNHNVPYETLITFKKDIREKLWTGKIKETEFWIRLGEQFPSIDIKDAQLMMRTCIKPLPAIKKVPFWSQFANIHLLSNHRAEWIGPIINPIRNYVTSIAISSQTGCCKPQAEIYVTVNSSLKNKENVLFIDDQEKNFKEARQLGWYTLLADKESNWIKKVMPILKEKI
ncbi:hypothetical protein [Scopulibacillus cellulosilyticus]|uniref:Hydrolase of the HAD superfamily n=1 Tax=Scopulibacillus cellulosilyticus TaxID=2665665 RepID=A0ABW2PYQ3_9BACL